MADHAQPRWFFWKLSRSFQAILAPSNAPKLSAGEAAQESRSRREFVLEMLDRSAEAFHSELDIQHMARLYRSKF